MFDFTTILDRAGKDSLAADKIPYDGVSVDEGFSRIPMWIADMSFPTAECVLNAMKKRLEMPNFGYFAEPDAYYNAIIRWHKHRKGVDDLKKEFIGYENGVLGGVASAVSAFTTPGDKLLLHSPTYVGFTQTIDGLGRTIVHSELERDENGIWRMNFEDMDAKIKKNNINFVIFCSPHNPTGRVWERWEIEKAMEVYAANGCVVVSDEIWSDIIMPGYTHIPTQTISEDAKNRTIAFYAPSKTFSIAGLVGSYHVIYNKYLRDRVSRQSESTHYNESNVLSMHALLGGYSDEGNAWTDCMISTISGNLNYACDFIEENWPGVNVMRPQGTYMLYLDCSEWLAEHGVTIQELLERGVRKGVIWQNGEAFMRKNTIRMNLALPFALEKEAFDRLKQYVFI
ncbi:MAG: aminotransferase class I/II-fold pyridoxal phosphate-dependent enzyme [Eubacteriales bacterium]|nr:aminotransferase class I/II-fold pyridoxal phosphate-dependent enzyme [Eubacteriales bacterium]